MTRTCAIVDAYSAGSKVARELMNRGFGVVHIQSAKEVPPYLQRSFAPDNFIERLVFDGELEPLIAKLKKYEPLFVLAGCESGVSFADILRDRLNLFPNDIKCSKARRNKFEMIQTLKESGLLTAAHFKTKTAAEILKWIHASQKWPIVIKPIESAATENVCVCSSDEEVTTAVNSIIGKTNILGLVNTEALAQSFLEGEEYIVNTVSWEGRHLLSDIWHMPKTLIKGAGRIYDRSELMEMNGDIQRKLCDYIFKALDALKIKFGPAHCEVMLTKDGPALIELGARVDGSNVYGNKTKVQIFDRHQVELTVDAFTNPEAFLWRIDRPNKIVKHALQIYLQSNKDGTIKGFNHLEEIKKLPSFWEMEMHVAIGGKLKRTIDMSTIPGVIWLAHDDRAQLFRDLDTVRGLEKDLYILM